MFAWKEKKNIRSQITRLAERESENTGVNRRAIGLVPTPSTSQHREVYSCSNVKYQKLLLAIEGKQFTCCLRVMSPTNKSRAAILLFRGRVLGCLYGRKGMDSQVFGQDALQYALADMNSVETMLEVYLLTEEIALAAASMFHSKVMAATEEEDPFDLLQRGIFGLLRTNSPGCVVINDSDDQAVCMIYLFGGNIVGIYSFIEGWLEPNWETAELCLSSIPEPRVVATALSAKSIEEVCALTFSLTGLSEQRGRPSFACYEPIDFNPYESQSKLPTFSLKHALTAQSSMMQPVS